MQEQQASLLQSMAIFGGLKDETLQYLLGECNSSQLKAGDHFFHQGDNANSMFVLESGRVAVIRQWHGKEYKIRELGQGDCFGEMALMDFSQRSASALAMDDCSAIEIASSNLYSLSKTYADQFTMIQMNMGREVCRRLRKIENRLFQTQTTGQPDVQQPTYYVI